LKLANAADDFIGRIFMHSSIGVTAGVNSDHVDTRGNQQRHTISWIGNP
jgi:hypothetical protein